MSNGSSRRVDEQIRKLPVTAISQGTRFIKPTAERISTMMESMKRVGLLNPIRVRSTSAARNSNTYEIVCGATRHKAAVKLGWVYMDARIIRAEHRNDYKIAELEENETRFSPSSEEHKRMQARLKELRAEKEADLKEALAEAKNEPKAKGGRGKKGGVSEAARKAGTSRDVARRVAKTRVRTKKTQVSGDGDKPVFDGSDTGKRVASEKKNDFHTGLGGSNSNAPVVRMKECPTCGGSGKVPVHAEEHLDKVGRGLTQ